MPTSEKVTMEQIARRANVSISTVSRVLHGGATVKSGKRQAVLQAVSELNYRPNILAQGLASGQTRTIGVVTQYISAPFFNAISQGIMDELRGSGYSALFADGSWHPEREQKSVHLFLDRQVDGLIVLSGATSNAFLQGIAAQVPLIVVGRSIPELANQCISFDDFQGGYRATQHLIEKGHAQIAHITGLLDHKDAQIRLDGYKQALMDEGLPVNEALIIEGGFTEQSGVLAMEMLFNRGRTFSAIFAANDQMAFGVQLALFRRGVRVPDDVSLVGFDDQPQAAYTIPPLTTIRQPAREMGQSATQALLHLIRGEPFTIPFFPAELVLRESVSRALSR